MGSLQTFLSELDVEGMITALLSAVAALVCLTVHELCHGLVSCKLGDPTAKNAGRLTLNPLRHLDPLGLLLMVAAHVGWAKPVPVDPRYFRRPKRDMALTALAGPVSNFLLAAVFLLISRIILPAASGGEIWYYILTFFLQAAILSVGLGVFNLFPIPPLDGSKIFFAFLPDALYSKLLRFERYGMILLLAAVWLGFLDTPITFLIFQILRVLCLLCGFPFQIFL